MGGTLVPRGDTRRRSHHDPHTAHLPRAPARVGAGMTRILVVDDEPQILRALRINLRRPPLRGRRRRRRRRGPARGRRLASRPGHPRPRPARHGRRRRHPRPARLDHASRSSCCPAGPAARTRSTPSTPAPTTTSPSRSASTSCSPASAPSPGATATQEAELAHDPASATTSIDLAEQDRLRRRAAHPDRVAPAGDPAPQPRQADQPAPAAAPRCGGPNYVKETHYLRQYMAQLRRKLERDPAHPVHLHHRTRHGLPLQTMTPRR